MIEIILNKTSALLLLPERTYGTIKRVGMFNSEPILYGDINQVKPGSLYYIPGVKQVYRYIKPIFRKGVESNTSIGGVQVGNPKLPKPTPVEEYHFTTIEPTSTEGLSIPEEEKGKIRNAGYLFNEIIYSGDPNLVENGSLFYHKTLPYISIVSNVDGVINLSTKALNDDNEVVNVVTEYRVSPETDYSKQYFTITALNNDITVSGTFSYRISNSWEGLKLGSITVPAHKSVQIKSINRKDAFSIKGKFTASGNIMSITQGDDFENAELTEDSEFADLFMNSEIVSAKNLILPENTTEECYSAMFKDCTFLTEAPELPATTLSYGCYSGMFSGCESLVEAPVLLALNLQPDCYTSLFNGCTSLKYIKAMFTTTPSPNYTTNWVKNVPTTSDGVFVKNTAALWNVVADNLNSYCGSPLNWVIERASSISSEDSNNNSSNEITI